MIIELLKQLTYKTTMAKLNPYLNYQGNTEEAFNFYKSVFGGDFSSIVRFKEMPGDGNSMPGTN